MSLKEDVIEFPFMIPPDFVEKMACSSNKRYIAFYWSARSDEVAWNDGDEEGINGQPNNHWHAFMHQAPIEHFLCEEKVDFGHPDSTARQWLLFDTVSRRAYIVPISVVGKVLKRQNLRNVTIGTRSDRHAVPKEEEVYGQYYG